MAGYPYMYETLYGAGYGYAEDFSSGYAEYNHPHSTFVVWLVVFTLAAVAILGGLKVGGWHFVVKV